jgi:hypothetical protein
MKYLYVFIALILAGLIAYSSYQFTSDKYEKKLKHLTTVIDSMKNIPPQEIIIGIPDTTKRPPQKTKIIYVEVPVKNNFVDTIINKEDHLIRLKVEDGTLFADIECLKPETIIKQTDTVKVYIPQPVEVPIEIEVTPKTYYILEAFKLAAGIAAGFMIVHTQF